MDRRHQLVVTLFLIVLGYAAHWNFKHQFQQAETTIEKKIETAQLASTRTPQNTKTIYDFINKINETDNCYQSFACPYSQSDPRAYDIEVGKELAKSIQDLHKQFRKDSKSEELLKELGIRFIKSENGFVQEAALEILKDFKPDTEILEALTQGLESTYNPKIVELSLPELEKYLGSENESQVHQLLEKIMSGSHFAGETAAENILKFINPKSYPTYKNLLKTFAPGTKVHQNLKSALNEYERSASGG